MRALQVLLVLAMVSCAVRAFPIAREWVREWVIMRRGDCSEQIHFHLDDCSYGAEKIRMGQRLGHYAARGLLREIYSHSDGCSNGGERMGSEMIWVGGCVGTRYGCCPDGVTVRHSLWVLS
ncbi:hypothetical protein RRG08_034715 [Elysia crispata]|uniref:Uncharacterized protein n=1 Tax=Elysia crispata TaxID=231223 RepID=A0AAE1D809_9GAST|nr:hypothetical protein RRG08_034715 [Elysia crispata]